MNKKIFNLKLNIFLFIVFYIFHEKLSQRNLSYSPIRKNKPP